MEGECYVSNKRATLRVEAGEEASLWPLSTQVGVETAEKETVVYMTEQLVGDAAGSKLHEASPHSALHPGLMSVLQTTCLHLLQAYGLCFLAQPATPCESRSLISAPGQLSARIQKEGR